MDKARGAMRALQVLRALNANNGASIVELNRLTGISRPALYRLVRTLCAESYLRFDSDRSGYFLAPLVRQLSDGFDDQAWITDIASPVLDQLQRDVIWPTDLFTFHSDQMIMRRTTRRVSPWTTDGLMVGQRIPVLVTASGRAYLANQKVEVQNGVIDRLARSGADPLDTAAAKHSPAVSQMLDRVAKAGFATRASVYMPKTNSIAVPVIIKGNSLCSISVTYMNSALTPSDAVRRYVAPLMQAAEVIAKEFAAAPDAISVCFSS